MENFIFCAVTSTWKFSFQQWVIAVFLYTLKISKNLWFSHVFKGYRKRLVARKGLNTIKQRKEYRQFINSVVTLKITE